MQGEGRTEGKFSQRRAKGERQPGEGREQSYQRGKRADSPKDRAGQEQHAVFQTLPQLIHKEVSALLTQTGAGKHQEAEFLKSEDEYSTGLDLSPTTH